MHWLYELAHMPLMVGYLDGFLFWHFVAISLVIAYLLRFFFGGAK